MIDHRASETAIGGDLVKEILQKFSENLQQAINNNLLDRNYLVNYDYQRGRKAHGRIIGILTKVGFDLNFTVDMDCNFFEGNRFDIFYFSDNHVIALIDYESLNSYDVRGKFQHFERYIKKCTKRGKNDLLPKACILIVTLPHKRVKSIPYYCHPRFSRQYENEWKNMFDSEKKEKNGHQLYDYWYPKHREALLKINRDAFQRTVFCLCNLDENGLETEIWRTPDSHPIKLAFQLIMQQ